MKINNDQNSIKLLPYLFEIYLPQLLEVGKLIKDCSYANLVSSLMLRIYIFSTFFLHRACERSGWVVDWGTNDEGGGRRKGGK